MTDTLYFILFAVGAFLLFVIEVFIPGGVIGAVGVLCLFAACGFAVSAFGLATGLVISMALVLATLVGFMVWLIHMPNSRIGKRFSLESSLGTARSSDSDATLAGKRGLAETDLRPSGYARIENRKYDVVAARGFIPKGSDIEVSEVHGSRIVVRIPPEAAS